MSKIMKTIAITSLILVIVAMGIDTITALLSFGRISNAEEDYLINLMLISLLVFELICNVLIVINSSLGIFYFSKEKFDKGQRRLADTVSCYGAFIFGTLFLTMVIVSNIVGSIQIDAKSIFVILIFLGSIILGALNSIKKLNFEMKIRGILGIISNSLAVLGTTIMLSTATAGPVSILVFVLLLSAFILNIVFYSFMLKENK